MPDTIITPLCSCSSYVPDCPSCRERHSAGTLHRMPNAPEVTTAADFGLSDDDPRWLEIQASEARIEAEAPAVLPPCPAWCHRRDTGHGYDSTDTVVDGEPIDYMRSHSSRGSGALASVDVLEHNRSGVVTIDPPTVYVDANRPDLTLDQAARLAEDLEQAIELLRSLT